MERTEILRKANDYLAKEDHPYFKKDVEDRLLADDWAGLSDRFYTELDFGTGGLRGLIGGGTNRMNPFVVRKATQGLSSYIRSCTRGRGASAVIAFDSRNFSSLFASEAARVFCGNGIKTYLFSSLRPTPELSFAIRYLGADAGIVVTASHNPREYNGYKVYWSDGGQIVPPHDANIIREVKAVSFEIQTMELEDASAEGLLYRIDSEVDDAFVAMVKRYCLRKELMEKRGRELSVVYTPLHGTGTMLVERVLTELGIPLFTVPEQREPDGNFPTAPFPNPEIPEALSLSLMHGKKRKADLVMGTDPDADRLGIAVPDGDEFVLITGNQLGALLCDYIFMTRKEFDNLPEKPVFVKTIVTSALEAKIAASYGAVTYDVLTGFKYIAEKIRKFEDSGEGYVFGGEESYGYLVETETRDKDAVSAAAVTAEMTLYYRTKGLTLLDRLRKLYRIFGYYEEFQISREFKGERGLKAMQDLIEGLRKRPPARFGEYPVSEMKDYRDGSTLYVSTGRKEKDIFLPESNVLQFLLENGSVITVRPSGTEPKLKIYCSVKTPSGMDLSAAEETARIMSQAIRRDLDKIVDGFTGYE